FPVLAVADRVELLDEIVPPVAGEVAGPPRAAERAPADRDRAVAVRTGESGVQHHFEHFAAELPAHLVVPGMKSFVAPHERSGAARGFRSGCCQWQFLRTRPRAASQSWEHYSEKKLFPPCRPGTPAAVRPDDQGTDDAGSLQLRGDSFFTRVLYIRPACRAQWGIVCKGGMDACDCAAEKESAK